MNRFQLMLLEDLVDPARRKKIYTSWSITFQDTRISTSKTQNFNDLVKLLKQIPENNNLGLVLADQYSGLNLNEFKKILRDKKIPLIFTVVDSLYSNGLNEQLKQTLVNKIRCMLNSCKKKTAWTTIAQQCIFQKVRV